MADKNKTQRNAFLLECAGMIVASTVLSMAYRTVRDEVMGYKIDSVESESNEDE